MQYTFLKLYAPDSSLVCSGASRSLRDIGGLDRKYCDKIVEDVRLGIQRKVILPASIGEDNLKMLAVFFEMVESPPISVKVVTKLKLWIVCYYRRGVGKLDRGLVLAETGQKAEASVTSAIQTFGDVIADEICEPFFDGQILTTKIISK